MTPTPMGGGGSSPVSSGGPPAAAVAATVELIDSIYVAANTTSVSFGLGGDGVNNAEIDGDVDGMYEIFSYWVPPTANNVTVKMVPNLLGGTQFNSNYLDGRYLYNNRTYLSSTLTSDLQVHRTLTSSRASFSVILLNAKRGRFRMFTAHESLNANGLAYGRNFAGGTGDTLSQITSLGFVCSTASGILIGSEIHLYRRSVAS